MRLTAPLLLLVFVLPAVAPAQGDLHQDGVVSFRVRFGMTDTAETAWDGAVTVSGGELLRVRDWHPRPENVLERRNEWRLSTHKGVNFRWRPWERAPTVGVKEYYWTPGVIVDLKAGAGTRVNVRTAQGRFSFNVQDVSVSAPKEFLNGRVSVDQVPPAELLSDKSRENDFVTMLGGRGNEVWTAWVAFEDGKNQVLARLFDGSRWGPVQTVSDPGDIFLVKMGRDRQGRPWAFWSNQVDGNFDLYGRPFVGGRWGAVERLTTAPQPDVFHNVVSDAQGGLWVVWQGWRGGQSDVFARRYDGESWGDEMRVSDSDANDWEPAVAADSKGAVTVAWDTYDTGDYSIRMRTFSGGSWSAPAPVVDTKLYEAHVSIAYDKQDRLWAAWNESGMNWGKDTGFVLNTEGTRLYEYRRMRVGVWDGTSWKTPATDINESLPADFDPRHNDFPKLAVDADGRVWLFGRVRTLRQRDMQDETPAHRAAWEIWASTLDGESWTTPLHIPFTYSRQDVRWDIVADGQGDLWAAWPMDNRDFQDFLFQHGDVYAAQLPKLEARTAAPRLVARADPTLFFHDAAPTEDADLERIRNYSIDSGGTSRKIYRGDTHRHTEFSMDGNNDGSLFQTYRYAIDAAELDYLLVSEHNSSQGPDVEYINWLLQQTADVFSIDGAFQPFYGYERSITYPDGHRNILFAERGNPTLPITAEERNHEQGASRLYAYLKQYGGIAISHTSATGMGTDWRDNDPEVEPLVEIFQGDRVSAEYEGAPYAAFSENVSSAPGNFRPEGYVWNAWAKGYKLGVQAASDHLSTHISYACTIAEEFTRESMLAAMKQRHNYGATDNIILDYRLVADDGKEYLQGEQVTVGGGFKLSVKVHGTTPIRQIDIIKNQEFIHNRQRQPQQTQFTFVDNEKGSGEDMYYVRVVQEDNNIAWSSPIWVTKR